MSVENWLAKWPDKYQVRTISVRKDNWKAFDFKSYDSVFHVAGIAHNSSDPKLKDLYYSVNRDLTIEVAKKAKEDDVKQFIFMSSIIVYGEGEKGKLHITAETKPNPKNFYGDSKLQAEKGIMLLADASFRVAVLRPPMIYGPGSKGNYPKLVSLAKKIPIFPNFTNKRSMLYINKLCEYIRNIIDCNEQGFFFPQDDKYVCTSNLVSKIAKENGRKIRFVKLFNPLIRFCVPRVELIQKLFGDLYYDEEMMN